MSNLRKFSSNLPPEQQAIRDKCVHPTGDFVAFESEEMEQSISARFEQQVAKHRDRIALKTEQLALTYDELNKAANRVANAISAKEGRVRGQLPVALLFENGVQAITAILGALKAGTFYVALDPSFPRERIRSILEDSGTRLLVTNSQNIPFASTLTSTKSQLLDVDTMDASVRDENLWNPSSPEDHACLIYTSGSTGQPKGVLLNHRYFLHMAMIYSNDLHITPNDRLTLLHSWSVNACMPNLLGALLNGASLFPFDPRLCGGDKLASWLIQEQVTIYHSVPMVFRKIATTLTVKETFPHLRVINLSGAPMTRNDVALYKKRFPAACVLLHMIGTTETGWICRYFIDKASQMASSAVPIGYALNDTEIILLGDSGGEVDFGQAGEIAIKSRYLALGYWQKAELTAAKFLPCPNRADQRTYLTGDLGRMEPDGCLFHLGRKDFQAKVRGYRVEISEVEIALLKHGSVNEAAVIGRKTASGDTEIVAYFVPTDGQEPTVTELRRFLKEQLPDYMVPSSFVMLRAMPFTPIGKLDYGALPAPTSLRPQLEAAYVAPKIEIEKRIATVWQEVLGIEQVGLQDNFFDLGGQSVLLAQIHSKLQDIFQQDIPMVDMFKHTTINALAQYLGAKKNESATKDPLESLDVSKSRLKQLSERRQRTGENQ